MDAPPSAKRSRTARELEDELTDKPDAEVWFDDGNIVVAAVDDTKHVRHLFKCHRSVLAARLPALADMFAAGALASSASASEQHDGLPVIRLYDPHEDVRVLLGALYNPVKVPTKWWRRDDMETVASLIRLAFKYQADDLRARFTEVFEEAWPHTLVDWDKHREDMMLRIWSEPEAGEMAKMDDANGVHFYLPDPGKRSQQYIGFTDGCMAVTAILLGHQSDLPGILPAAFYLVNALYIPNFIYCYRAPDEADITDILPFKMSRLPADLLLRFSQGREWLQRQYLFLMQTRLHALARENSPCDEQSVCSEAIKEWWAKKLTWCTVYHHPRGDPLSTLQSLSNVVDKELQVVCHGCCKGVKAAFGMARLYIWNDLPNFFGIEKRPVVTRWEQFLHKQAFHLRCLLAED